jgi:two-component system, cell cycle response regulator
MKGLSEEGIRVLLVEDEQAEAVLIQRLLQSCCPGMFEVTHVQTMKEARREINSKKYKLLLLDLNLPDSAPMETVVLGGESVNNIPVIILSGRDDLEDLALELKIPFFLTKGKYDAGQLCIMLRKALVGTVAETPLA